MHILCFENKHDETFQLQRTTYEQQLVARTAAGSDVRNIKILRYFCF